MERAEKTRQDDDTSAGLVEPDGVAGSTKAAVILGLFTFAAMVFTTFLDLDRFPIKGSDEIGYLNAGLNNLSNQWNIYSFPIHSLTYALTGFVEADPLRNYKLNAFVPFFLMAFLLQLNVLRWTGSVLLAVLTAAPLFLAPEMGVRAWPHPNQTVCIILLGGLLLLPRNATLATTFAHFVTIFFLMAFTRSEQMLAFYLAALLISVWVVLALFKSPNRDVWMRRFLGPIVLSLALIATLSSLMGLPILLDRYRSLSAFSQHFAYGLSLRTDLAEHPWLDHAIVFERVFEDATSISGALRVNPSEFFGHLLSNFTQLARWAIDSDPIGALSWLLALLFFAGVGMIFVRRIMSGWQSGQFRNRDAARLICLAVPLPSLVLILLIFPRANYIQMSYVLLVVTSFFLLMWTDIPRIFRVPVSRHLAVLVAILVLVLIPPVPERPDPQGDVVQILRNDALRQGVVEMEIISTSGICPFIEVPCRQIEIPRTREGLTASLRDSSAQYVVLAPHPERPDLQEDLLGHLDRMQEAEELFRWQVLDSPDGWRLLRALEP
jgi:hypothetical protein